MWLPAAIRYGIPYTVFWELNPRILLLYREEYIKRQEEKARWIDFAGWLSGQYIVNAVQTALNPRKVKYAAGPFMEMEREQEKISPEEKFILWVEEYNRRFDEKTGGHRNQNKEQ